MRDKVSYLAITVIAISLLGSLVNGEPIDRTPPPLTSPRRDVRPFEYVEAKVPIYRAAGGTELIGQMQKPLDPIESSKHFVHPQHLDVQLVISEPDLGGKPIAFNWDERGRLWVAVTRDYPNNLQPQGQGNDRILICEDTDGDGRIDKIKVFADRLSIPTSFIFAYGGIVVHCPPHTFFLRDLDGDDRADEWHTLITGWGTYDTHAGPSNLIYGLDNWIYGTVGYAGFQGTIAGESFRFGQGIYRFRLENDPANPKAPPRVSQFEFLRSTTNNTWGLGISEEGEIFASTANGNPSVYLDIPNRYYEKVQGWSAGPLLMIAESARFYPITDKVRQVDFHGRFTAASGHMLYTARRYPQAYWNRAAFVAEPTGHLVATMLLERHGSGYRSRYGWNLIASDDEWCAPIAAAVGPDGNVWIIDWYSYIVQHNPTPPGFRTGRGNAYETPLRDYTHGRIYRLVQKNAPPYRSPNLSAAGSAEWAKQLRNDNLFWRLHAQRLLVENRCLDVVSDLAQMLDDRSLDACGLNTTVIHALWTLHGLGVIRADGDAKVLAAVGRALQHPSYAVRKNAIQVLPATSQGRECLVNSGVLKDSDSLVRKVAWLRLADMPSDPLAITFLAEQFLNNSISEDRGLLDAYTIAAATHANDWFAALSKRKIQQLDGPWYAVFERVMTHTARRHAQRDVETLLTYLDKWPTSTQEAILSIWIRSATKPMELSQENQRRLEQLIEKVPKTTRRLLLTLAARWNSPVARKHISEIVSDLRREITDEALDTSKRLESARLLLFLARDDDEILKFLESLINPQSPPEWIEGLANVLAESNRGDLSKRLTKLLPQLTPAGRKALIKVFLTRQDWLPAFLDALNQGTISSRDLSLEDRQSLLHISDKRLAPLVRKALSATGGLPNPDRQKVIDSLLYVVKTKGNAEAGKTVFQNHCAKCHTYQGTGNKIGPDLTGMAVHSKEHLLIEILDPSRSVEGNYRQYLIATKSGQVLTGLLVAESKTAVELLDAEGKKHVLPRDEIEQIQASSKSLMPEGFEQQLKPQELADLLEFLTQRGKYIPLPLERAATMSSARGMFYRADARQERLVFPDWQPKIFRGVPFHVLDPQDGHKANVILLYSPQGTFPPKMPKSVDVPCNVAASAIHMLSGVSGWGFPLGEKGSVSLIVRLHYEDGRSEDHQLKNGEHFADYIRRVDVPGSEFAFALGQQQIRYLVIRPKRPDVVIRRIEFVKGPDNTAPIIMAVTAEASDSKQ